MTDLRVQVVTSDLEFAALGDSWQRLAALDEQATLFNDWQWNSVWWKHYRHLGDLHVVLVYKDEQLVGLGPFYRDLSKAMGLGKIDTLRFLGTGGDTSPDSLNTLSHPAMQQQVADAICNHLFDEKFQRLLLVDVCEGSAFHKAFQTRVADAAGYAPTPVTRTRRFADLPDNWASYRSQISRNTHKQIKRRENRLKALDSVQFNLCRTQAQIDVAFDALVRLHMSRWQTKGHSGSFGSEDYCNFHKELMRELFLQDQLWLITLEINGEIVGVEYAFLYQRTLMFFQTGFNPDYKRLSPGHQLMTYAIKTAIESGVRHIDLLKGDYEYKTSYANQKLGSVDIGYYAKSVYSFMAKVKDQRIDNRWGRTTISG